MCYCCRQVLLRDRPLSTRPLFVPAVHHVTISDDIAFRCNINTPSEGFVLQLVQPFVIIVRVALQDACVVHSTGPGAPVKTVDADTSTWFTRQSRYLDNTLVLCDTDSLLK